MSSQPWLPIGGYSKLSLPKRWRQGIRAACVTVALLSLSACAGRYLGTPATADLPPLGLSARTKELSVTLNHVITPNGPGSWVKAARWDEYVVTVRSLSSQPLTIEKIQLVDQGGVYRDSDGDPQRLAKVSDALLEKYQDRLVEKSHIPIVIGAAAAGAASPVLLPVALVGAPAYLLTKHITQEKDRDNIEREFAQRQLALSTLAGYTTVTGSRFFPTVPKPKAFVVTYRVHQRISLLQIPLPTLLGLHAAPGAAPGKHAG